jgi:serine protease Do
MSIPVPGRIAEVLRRSTVQVRSGSGRRQGCGSAVVLHGEQLVTNAHVLTAPDVTVESWEGKTTSATIVKRDRRRDLALLAAPGLDAVPAQLGDSAQLKAGAPLIAVGNPLGFVGAVSTGVVHSIGPIENLGNLSWVRADIRLAPGNSGGPLADWRGQVIGVNTMIISGGLALAVPSRDVQRFLQGKNSQLSLGVVIRPVAWKGGELGMMILELVEGSAAEQASLLPGDILVAADGRRFRSVDDLQASIDEAQGMVLHLDFYRGGQNNLRQVTARLLPERVKHAA